MAIYEVKCEKCGHVWEIMQKFDDPLPETCTKCGEGPVIRLMSTGGFTIDWWDEKPGKLL